MDERVRRTLDTYESVAQRYAEVHDDREKVADIVARFLDALAGSGSETDTEARVLDVGCGPGWETATFEARGIDSVGLDLTTEFLADASERAPGSAFLRADMCSLPLVNGRFDGLWACASLLHVPRAEVPETLQEFARVLTDDGVLGITMKRANSDQSTASPYETDDRHFERYETDELRAFVADAGFAVTDAITSERWTVLVARQ